MERFFGCRPRRIAVVSIVLSLLVVVPGLAQRLGIIRAQEPESVAAQPSPRRVPPPRSVESTPGLSPPVPDRTLPTGGSADSLPPRPLAGEVLEVHRARRSAAASDPSTRRTATGEVANAEGQGRLAVPTKAIARFYGSPAPGLKLELDATRSIGEDLRFSWLQTRGPKIDVGRPDSPRLLVTVPSDASELAFVLFASGRGGTDRTELVIPLVLHPGSGQSSALVADAGDDQTAVVEHRVTLNGLRSRQLTHAGDPGAQPGGGRLAYRWIQVSGPAVSLVEQSWVCIFTPHEPGHYRFLLVVAATGEISQPAAVDVWVTDQVPSELAEGAARQPETTPSKSSAG